MKRPCIERVNGAPCPEVTERTRCAYHEQQRRDYQRGQVAADPRRREQERARQQQRNADPRRAIYRGAWPAHSRQRMAEEPVCQSCGLPFVRIKNHRLSPTVDHASDAVLHRACHSRIEAERRRMNKR